MDAASFTRMEDGTKEEYELLEGLEASYAEGLPDRILLALKELGSSLGGYAISRLEHSLQSATRAKNDGANEEMIVAALVHDIGDALSPYNHSDVAAAVLKPYVSEKTHWIIAHHGVFQMYYFGHHLGMDRNARDLYKDHQWYQDTVDFCYNWDQNCFDPDYQNMTLEEFEPMVRRIFTRKAFAWDTEA